MDTGALLLSRIQFAFTVSFHIIFPAFTIGVAAWLAYLEACSLVFKRIRRITISHCRSATMVILNE